MNNTEQGRATRAAETAARAAATQGRQDSAAAAQKRSEQRVGPGGDDRGTSDRMSQREAAAGLNLAGNNPLSGRGDSFYTFNQEIRSEEITDQGVHDQSNDVLPRSAFDAIICVNGKPHFASIQGEIGDEIGD
tara:strand:- start:91 stop:489 length:399 start_codon:yes stop_codon:yes gene_type:complete